MTHAELAEIARKHPVVTAWPNIERPGILVVWDFHPKFYTTFKNPPLLWKVACMIIAAQVERKGDNDES